VEQWEQVKNSYVVNHAMLARAKQEMIVMHPLPRVNGEAAPLSSKLSLMSSRRDRS
jgi:ornithine carbamoyltransferase